MSIGRLRPVDQQSIRRHNLGLVLRHVAERGPRSRATIASETGLNKTTVSSLVGELIERGLLRQSGQERPGAVGRPAQNVALNGDAGIALGLEINVDYLAAWVSDLAGVVRQRAFVVNDNRTASPEEAIAHLARLVEEALAQPFAGRGPGAPAGATLAVPGLTASADGHLVIAPNLHWTDVPVGDLLREALGQPTFPVRVENEANLGAVAELAKGVGRQLRDFIYVSGEIGIGAGIVVGGELFRGSEGFAGELGHLTIEPDGPRCGCGSRGCLEQLAGQEALLRMAGLEGRMPSGGDRPDWPGAMLAERARDGDAKTLQALERAGQVLGIGVAALVNLFNPQAVVLGGYFAPLVEWLSEPLQSLEQRSIASRATRCRLIASRLGGEAAVRGAVALTLRDALADPASIGDRAMAS